MALWCSLQGLLEKGIDYWGEGDIDIIPAGVVGQDVYEFDRGKLPEIIPPEFYQAKVIWLRYRDGFLMYSGGVMSQPVSHSIIIGLFQAVYQKWERYKRKK